MVSLDPTRDQEPQSTSTSLSVVQTVLDRTTYDLGNLTVEVVGGTFTLPITATLNVPRFDSASPGMPIRWSTKQSVFFATTPSTPAGQTLTISSASTESQAPAVVVTKTKGSVSMSPINAITSSSRLVSTKSLTSSPKPSNNASSNAIALSAKSAVSTGAMAGAAVACFFVGLITAVLIMCALRSHRSRRKPDGLLDSAAAPPIAGSIHDSSHNDHKYVPLMPVAGKTTDKALPSVTDPLDESQQGNSNSVAPPPAPSQTAGTTYPPSSFAIKRKRISAMSTSALTGRSVDMSDRTFSELRTQVKTIFEQLDMHVDNFYTEASGLPLTEDHRHDLQQLDSPYLPDSIIGLLPEVSGDRIKSLTKHCLAYAIFSRIGGSSTRVDNDDILLPNGLPAIIQAIRPAPTIRANNPETYEQHIERLLMWNHETVALMDTHAMMKSADMQRKINKLAWKCVKGLEPWSVARYGTEAKKSHLMRAMEEAVELCMRVFGEKKGWLVWQWEQNTIDAREGMKEGGFVLFPGLELRKELGSGRVGLKADGESDRNVGGNGSSRAEVILAPSMASL